MNTVDNIFNFEDLDSEVEKEALVLTHPYHALGTSKEGPYLEFLYENEDKFDVYFVGGKTIPDVQDSTTLNPNRIDLPPGYLNDLYEGAVREEGFIPGRISSEDAVNLLEENDRILFGGENLFMCLRRTYNDFVDEKEEIGEDTELGILEQISFAPVTTPEGYEAMDSLEQIRTDDLPIYNPEILKPDFKGDNVTAFQSPPTLDQFNPQISAPTNRLNT